MKIRKLLLALFILPLTSCGINVDNKAGIIEADRGIKIKLLNSGTDANNHPYQTFTYSIYPTDAYYNSVTPSIAFADSRANGSSYLTASINSQAQECTVTCLQAFDSIATLTLTANQGGAAASVEIHYRQRRFGCTVQNATYTLSNPTETYRGTVINDPNKSFYRMVRENMTTTKSSTYTDSVADFTYSFGAVSDARGSNWITSNHVFLGGVPSNPDSAQASSSWGSQGGYAQSVMNDVMGAFTDLDLDQAGPYGDAQAIINSNGGRSTSIMACMQNLIYNWGETGGTAGQGKLYSLGNLFDSDGYLTLTFKISGTFKMVENGVSSQTWWLTCKIPDHWGLRNRSTITSMSPESGSLTF